MTLAEWLTQLEQQVAEIERLIKVAEEELIQNSPADPNPPPLGIHVVERINTKDELR